MKPLTAIMQVVLTWAFAMNVFRNCVEFSWAWTFASAVSGGVLMLNTLKIRWENQEQVESIMDKISSETEDERWERLKEWVEASYRGLH